jgi:hypothetical protein
MKMVIEILKQAESEVSCVCVAADGKYPGRNRKLLDSTIRHIREAIDELKTPRLTNEGDQRVQCNWCESVFDEEHIRVIDDTEYCPVCDKTGYLMDITKEEAE